MWQARPGRLCGPRLTSFPPLTRRLCLARQAASDGGRPPLLQPLARETGGAARCQRRRRPSSLREEAPLAQVDGPFSMTPSRSPTVQAAARDSSRLSPRLPEISRSPAAQASRSATKTCPSPSRSPTASRACARFGRTSCCPRCWTAPDASSATPARDYPRLPQRLPGIRLQLSRRRPCQRAARPGGVRAAERRRREPSVARAPQRLAADIRARARRWRVRWPLHMSRTRP